MDTGYVERNDVFQDEIIGMQRINQGIRESRYHVLVIRTDRRIIGIIEEF
jgi:hypothetical protein